MCKILLSLNIVGMSFFLFGCGGIHSANYGLSTNVSSSTNTLDTVIDNPGGEDEPGPVVLPPVENPNAIYVNNATELQTALSKLSNGDVIVLNSNNYGALSINGKLLTAEAEVRVGVNQVAQFTTVTVNNSSYIRLNGFKVRPSSKTTAVSVSGSHLIFENADISFSDNASGWDVNDWNNIPGNGITLSGDNIKIYNNHIKNVNFGITGSASEAHVKGNIVDFFAGDGLRPLGNNGLWESNLITNNINVNDNHDDGIQTWTLGSSGPGSGVQTNLILRKNTIIESTSPNKPFPGPLQGIGLFDGTYKDFLIEDNVIVVNDWHGISVYGAENVTIQYNTVVDLSDPNSLVPWIKINNHKNGTPPVNCVVRNNLTADLNSEAQVVESGNQIINYNQYGNYFVDPTNFNFRLKEGAPVSNVGARF